jgi:hypothetical protein
MSELNEKEQAPVGRGHTVKRNIGGKEIEIPWGFTDHRKEGRAAKAAEIEYPATSRAAE